MALLRGAAVYLLLPGLIAYLVVRLLVPSPTWPTDPVERALNLEELGLNRRAMDVLEQGIGDGPAPLPMLGLLIRLHGDTRYHDDPRFLTYLRSHCAGERDLCPYALAAYHLAHDEAALALRSLGERGKDEGTPERVLRGSILRELGRDAEVVQVLAPLAAQPNSPARAVWELAESYLTLGRWDELRTLVRSDSESVPYSVLGSLLLHDGRLGEYILLATKAAYVDLWWPYVAVVLLATVLWFLYVRRVDLFAPEPLALCIVAVIGGGASDLLVRVIAQAEALLFSWSESGAWLTDLAYYVVIVGLQEELVKLLPVLAIAKFSRHVDEPVDWFVYGALSGLGFAALENLHYAEGHGPWLIVGRSFACAPLHMVFTGLLAAAVPEAHARKLPAGKLLFAALVLVGSAHGLYDWLVTRRDGPWPMLGRYFVLLLALLFMRGIGHALARSPVRVNAVPEHHFLGDVLARAVGLVASALLVAEAFRTPEEYRPAMIARTLFSTSGLGLPLIVLSMLQIPASWSPTWWKVLVRTPTGDPPADRSPPAALP